MRVMLLGIGTDPCFLRFWGHRRLWPRNPNKHRSVPVCSFLTGPYPIFLLCKRPFSCTRSWKYFFSRLMFISASSPLVLCMYKFVLNLFCLVLYFFFAGLGSAQLKECVSVLPVGLYECNIATAHCTSNTNNYV